MANPSIEYAEKTLGVNSVYESANLSREALSLVMGQVVDLRRSKREYEALLSDLEFDILTKETGENASMSQAALDRHMKMVYSSDTAHRELRKKIREIAGSIDAADAKKVVLEADIRVFGSRLVELGGYMQYLAAVKIAQPKKTA
jgi:hypothetical protein